jgi:hypothetical protein
LRRIYAKYIGSAAWVAAPIVTGSAKLMARPAVSVECDDVNLCKDILNGELGEN